MKYIITESQNLRLKVLRRLDDIEDDIEGSVIYRNPCSCKTLEEFLIDLKFDFFLNLWADWLHSNDEDKLWEIIMDLFGEKIINHYNDSCN